MELHFIVEDPADDVALYMKDNSVQGAIVYRAIPFDLVQERIERARNLRNYEGVKHLLIQSSTEPPRFYPVGLILDPSVFLPVYCVAPLERLNDALERIPF